MIILDTNVISELMRIKGDKNVKQWVASQPQELLYTTSVTQAEILYGIAILHDGKKLSQLSEKAHLMFSIDFANRILNLALLALGLKMYNGIHSVGSGDAESLAAKGIRIIYHSILRRALIFL